MYGPVRDLSSLSNTVFKALAGAERVIELLDERPRVTDGPLRLDRVRGAIELDDVWFSYDDRRVVRDSVRAARRDAAVAPGERVALVGASGAGKSTIARMLLRWGDPDRGSCGSTATTCASSARLAAPQRGAAAAGDARAARQRARQHRLRAAGRKPVEIEAAARAAGAREFIAALPAATTPSWASAVAGCPAASGQIAIARALLADAPVLVLDEPTTGLDAELAASLGDLMRDRTTLVISHDLVLTRDADLIVVLDEAA